jgi:aminoglycoside phosphotransferase (APT) family kinase protein
MPIELPGRGERLFAFMVEEKMPFQTAREKGKQLNIARALEQLGDLSRQIHSVPCQGYGLDFDSVRDAFAYSSFSSFMDAKMQSIDRSPISQLMKNWLMARANELRAIAVEPTLFHRDLLANPGNYLVDDEGNVRGIIDWEFAGSGAAFHFEIASMLYVLERDGYSQERIDHDLSAILRGYQMSLATYRAFYERDIETIVLMNSISAMLKFAEVQKNGTAAQEPWRKLFAERAEYRLAKAAAVSSVTCSG